MKNAICTWNPVDDVDGYNVYLKFDEGEFEKQNTELITDLEYTIEDVADGEYEAYVTAVREGQESDPSEIVEFEVGITPDILYEPNIVFNVIDSDNLDSNEDALLRILSMRQHYNIDVVGDDDLETYNGWGDVDFLIVRPEDDSFTPHPYDTFLRNTIIAEDIHCVTFNRHHSRNINDFGSNSRFTTGTVSFANSEGSDNHPVKSKHIRNAGETAGTGGIHEVFDLNSDVKNVYAKSGSSSTALVGVRDISVRSEYHFGLWDGDEYYPFGMGVLHNIIDSRLLNSIGSYVPERSSIDFSSLSNGSIPSSFIPILDGEMGDFSIEESTVGNITYLSDSIPEKSLVFKGVSSGSLRGLLFDDLQSSEEGEVLTMIKASGDLGSSPRMMIGLRGSDGDGVYGGIRVEADRIDTSYIIDGSANAQTFTAWCSRDTWFFIRLRFLGGVIYIKVWELGGDEPDEWTAERSISFTASEGKPWMWAGDIERVEVGFISYSPNAMTALNPLRKPIRDLYKTDFGNESLTLWSERNPYNWVSEWENRNVRIEDDTLSIYGGAVLTATSASGTGRVFQRLTDIPEIEDCEVLILMQTTQLSGNQLRIHLRSGGAEDNERGYFLDFTGGDVSIRKYDEDSSTVTLRELEFTWSTGTWYWARFRIEGTELSAKVWEHGTSEPGDWSEQVLDTEYSHGYFGVGWFTYGGNKRFDYLAMSFDGSTVPLPE